MMMRTRWLVPVILLTFIGVGFFGFRAAASDEALEMSLTVEEPAGVDRVAEPVTSGVPLPKGVVTDASQLVLVEKASDKVVPCQFTVLSRWQEGTVKWVLLDFFCDVKANQTAAYVLRRLPGDEQAGEKRSALSQKLEIQEDDESVKIDTGPLNLVVSKKNGALFSGASVNGARLFSSENPPDAVLEFEDGNLYRTSLCAPDLVSIEDRGPLRGTVIVRGRFTNKEGKGIFGGKIAYNLRLTAYAGKPYVKIAFTLENNAGIFRKHEWVRFKFLSLDFPVGEGPSWTFVCADGKVPVAEKAPACLVQWFKYPIQNNLGWEHASSKADRSREESAGMKKKFQGFYYLVNQGDEIKKCGEKAAGWAAVSADEKPVLGACVRRIWQNFPRGFEARPGKFSVLLWPAGGCWPRSEYIADRTVYQIDSNRFKTAEVLLCLGPDAAKTGDLLYSIESPLFARASLDWYRRTGAVWPLASTGVRTGDKDIDEAISRYDRLQEAKVYTEKGDPAGPIPMGKGIALEDQWGKVSIPGLRDKYPDIYYGFMNYGDLVWAHGYCSLFYDWPYGMMVQHLRFNDRAMFDVADDMVRHRYDIDRGAGWQRYEKGQHGFSARIMREKYRRRGGFSPHPSHTWCRGLLLHWALTGDPQSLETARRHAEAYSGILGKKEGPVSYREFRIPGWAIEACLAMYEYGGDSRYLEKATEIFTRTFLAMEQKNGSCGHIMPEGNQSTQFVSYMIEPVARLHHLTQKPEVAEFLKRVLDWHRKKGVLYGKMDGDKYCPLEFVNHWKDVEEDPNAAFATSRIYGFMFADGYSYLHSVFNREEDLAFARKVFRDSVFYYGLAGLEVSPEARTPLGFHLRGNILGMSAKAHAFTTRYCQLAVSQEEMLSRKKGQKGR